MRVVVAEDVLLTRAGIVRLLTDAGIDVVGEADDVDSLMRQVGTHAPDIVISDIRMPPTHRDEGLVAAARIQQEHPGTGILILSQYVESEYAMQLLREHPGGVGYLLKERVFDIATVIDALRRIADDECVVDPTIIRRLLARPRPAHDPLDGLTAREREVLTLVAEGRSNDGIAEALFITPRTVEAHVSEIFAKLHLEPGTNRRVMAVLTYLKAPR
ncbi:MAG TPA: response regulator transcription factor [Dermatophilaceae bacterium]|nr:response regulator transcription factor [Dermatophilaceae bacterium]